MSFSLHQAIIPSYLQTLGAVSGLIDKAEQFSVEHKLPPAELIQARLAADMLPFAYQVKSCAVHSLGAVEGVRLGKFSPDMTPPPDTFEALKARIATASQTLQSVDPQEVESFLGRDMCFAFGERRIDFTAENFLLSFSLPNFYFHAATAYDILRWKGVVVGKRDFMGAWRMKKPAS